MFYFIFWFYFGFLAYGITIGYFTGKYEEFSLGSKIALRVLAVMFFIQGPFGLIAVLLPTKSEKHYLKYGLRYF